MTEEQRIAPTDHVGLEVLAPSECDELLGSNEIGRVAFVQDGDVNILPVTYRFHRGTIVFRTADGSKLSAAGDHRPVAFEIDGLDASDKSGWSVLVKGIARDVDDKRERALLDTLGLKPWAPWQRIRRWVRISPDEITGRRIP